MFNKYKYFNYRFDDINVKFTTKKHTKKKLGFS